MSVNWEKTAGVLAGALETIGEIVSSVKERRAMAGVAAAADALTAIGAVVEATKRGDLTQIDPDIVAEEIDRLRRALADNDAAADRALAEKFDTAETGEE